MPISTNAPFDEFGFSMVLRHLEMIDIRMAGIVGDLQPGGGQGQSQLSNDGGSPGTGIQPGTYDNPRLVVGSDGRIRGITDSGAGGGSRLTATRAGGVRADGTHVVAGYATASGLGDLSGAFNVTTGIFTAPANGLYCLNANAYLESGSGFAGTYQGYLQWKVAGAAIQQSGYAAVNPPSVIGSYACMSPVVWMNVNDQASVETFFSNPAALGSQIGALTVLITRL